MADVRRNEMTGTNDAYGQSAQVEPGVCTVLHCTDESASLLWPTENAAGGWPITWAVCAYHYWQLDSGKACAKVNEGAPAANRWLLMDDDLEPLSPPGQARWASASV